MKFFELVNLQAQKKAVAQAYNKMVCFRNFKEGNLVWKAMLLIGSKEPIFGKWSPNWEESFIMAKVLGKGAYQLQDMDHQKHAYPINGYCFNKSYKLRVNRNTSMN